MNKNTISKAKTQSRPLEGLPRYYDEKRRGKLEKIKAKLEQGLHVQNRDLQTWLTKDEFESIAELWEKEKERRESLFGEKPSEVKEYVERLAKAIFTYNKADSYSNKGRHAVAKKLMYQSQAEFESALEWLQECYSIDMSIRQWFDRDIDCNSASLDPDGVPRVVTSRSLSRQTSASTQSIASIKLQVVNWALSGMNREPDNEADRGKHLQRLKTLLKTPDLDGSDLF